MENPTVKPAKESANEERKRRAREGLAEAREFIYLAVAFFLIGAVIGFAFPESFRPFFMDFEEYLEDRFAGRDALVTILLIFIQNFMAAVIAIIFGFLLGLVPVLSAVTNGILLGVVISMLAGSNQLLDLWKILPHGIFELPAIFIAWGLGIWCGAWFFRKDRSETLGSRRRKAALAFFVYSLPLLGIAAVIEGLLITL